MLVAVGLFSLGNSSDLFLILRAQNLGVRAALAPGLGLLFNLVYTSLSWPAGKLSDQIPRRMLVVLGYFVYGGGVPGILARAGTAGRVVPVRSIWNVLCADGRGDSRLDRGPGSQLISRVCFRSVQLAGRRGGPSREPGGGVVVAPLFSPRPLLHFRLTLILCGFAAVAGLKPPASIEKDQP